MGLANKAQVSMEYMAVFAIAALMTVPLLLIFTTQSSNIRNDITITQTEQAASRIIDSASEVYYMGYPSQKTLRIDFPQGIDDVLVDTSSLLFTVRTETGTIDLYKQASFNLSGNISSHKGPHLIIFKADPAGINISEKQ